MSGSRYVRRRKKIRRLAALGLCLAVLAGCVALERNLGPVLRSAAKIRAEEAAVSAMHEALNALLAESGTGFSDLVDIRRDETGRIVSVSADAFRVNKLKADLTLSAQNRLNELAYEDIAVPLGSLTGEHFLIGRGPEVRIKFRPRPAVFSDFESTFSSAGINQTRHAIYLKVRADLQFSAVGYKTPFQTETRFLVAESIIVGTTPDAYTQVIETDETVGDIMDFGALSAD